MFARLFTHMVSRLAGWLATLPVPRLLRAPLWRAVAKGLGANLAEAAAAPQDYPTFQAFFTRQLKPGLQPIASAANAWISPADCLWLSHVAAHGDDFVPAKNNHHRLSQLLAGLGPTRQNPWPSATISTFYLRPKDYHRVHAPCDLSIDAIRAVRGTLWPVNAWGQRIGGLFGQNERLILRGRHGQRQVFVVLVGALMVGSIVISHPLLLALKQNGSPANIKKGEELGMFCFGSTVIVVIDQWIDAKFSAPIEIRMGYELFRA